MRLERNKVFILFLMFTFLVHEALLKLETKLTDFEYKKKISHSQYTISQENIKSTKNKNGEKMRATSFILKLLQNLFEDIENLTQDLINSLAVKVPTFYLNTEELITQLSSHLAEVTNELSSKLFEISNIAMKTISKAIQHQSLQLQYELKQFAKKVDEKFDWSVTYLNETLMNQTESIDLWAAYVKNELRTINNTQLYKEGCALVDNITTLTTTQLQNCCNITIKPMRSLCKHVRVFLLKILESLVDTIDHLQICLEDKRSYMDYMLPCISKIYEDISGVLSQILHISHRFNSISPIKMLYSQYCISIVLVEMEQQQKKVEADLLTNNNFTHLI